MNKSRAHTSPSFIVEANDVESITKSALKLLNEHAEDLSAEDKHVVRTAFGSWAAALITGMRDDFDIESDLMRLLSAAPEDTVLRGFERAADYLVGRTLTQNEVSSILIRNIYQMYHRKVECRTENLPEPKVGYYFDRVAFLCYVFVTWNWYLLHEPDARVVQQFVLP